MTDASTAATTTAASAAADSDTAGYSMVSCAVCRELITDPEQKYTLRCSHAFHRTCVTQWLQVHVTCPVCRQPYRDDVAVPTATPLSTRKDVFDALVRGLLTGTKTRIMLHPFTALVVADSIVRRSYLASKRAIRVGYVNFPVTRASCVHVWLQTSERSRDEASRGGDITDLMHYRILGETSPLTGGPHTMIEASLPESYTTEPVYPVKFVGLTQAQFEAFAENVNAYVGNAPQKTLQCLQETLLDAVPSLRPSTA